MEQGLSVVRTVPALEVRSAVKRFTVRGKTTTAFENVSFRVERHEVVAIVGASGAGKTTLLLAIAGQEPLNAGSISVCGINVSHQNPPCAMVFQNFALFPWRTALENVAFPLEIRGIRNGERRERAIIALRAVGLEGSAEKYPGHLSGGMNQRVAIARAIVTGPDLVLLDEPMSSLDVVTREAIRGYLADLFRSVQQTVVIVTHSISEAVFLADRVIVFSGHPGRVLGDVVTRDKGAQAESIARVRALMSKAPPGSAMGTVA